MMFFRATCLAVFTSLTIAADSGHLPSQLVANAQQADKPAPLLWVAIQQNDMVAKQRLLVYAVNQRNEYWLEMLIKSGYSPAALALSRLEDNPRVTRRLVRLAARGGVAEAQYEYALTRDDFDHRETWLKAAAEQDYAIAQTALADWYLLHEQQSEAEPWLEKTALSDSQSAFQLAYIRWQQGNEDEGYTLFKRAAEQNHEQAKSVVAVLKQYQPQSINALSTQGVNTASSARCRQRIQPFATGLAEMVQANEIYQQFLNDKRLKTLPLCINKPVWLARDAIRCDANWQGQGRLGCNVEALEPIVRHRSFTHAVILAKSGKANVNNGVMYLDVGDTYSVFVHELAHFVGFVDEYPLTRSFAREYCARQTAPNLVFLGKLTYAPLNNIDYWQSIEFPVNLYPSRTCKNIGVKSFKPSNRITFMENHDAKYIPPIYLSIWNALLNNPKAQRSIAMNLFQYFEKTGNTEKASYWLAVVRQQRAVAETDVIVPTNTVDDNISAD